jgi:hypothetical protein
MIQNITITILEQLKRHISQLTPREFSTKLTIFNGSSIGGHARHIIEFYDCLLQSAETGIVNYDARQRDLQIEQNLAYALAIVEKMIKKLQNIDFSEKKLYLASTFGTFQSEKTPTSFEREAIYLIEHSIHHFALMRIGIQTCYPKISVEKEFGVAFSTLDFREEKVRVESRKT